LPQRVKAIVYQKHLYWEEVYPRMGESHMRLAIEREAHYAATYPFVDYGSDLAIMSQLEQGVKIERLKRSEADMKEQDMKMQNTVEKYLAGMKCKKYNKVPERFIGRGGAGYMLYDWSFNRGRRAAKVSQTFKDIVRRQGTKEEHLIKGTLLERSKVRGIRYAVMKAKWK
jgi:hypothetical protein